MTNTNKPDGSGAIAPVLETNITTNNGRFMCEWRLINIPPNAINYMLRVQRNPSLITHRLINNYV